MARKAKTHYIGGRVDDDDREQILEYIEAAEMTMGELIRAATKEFMFAHPVRNSAGELETINPTKE
jgi:hypothetical protein